MLLKEYRSSLDEMDDVSVISRDICDQTRERLPQIDMFSLQ